MPGKVVNEKKTISTMELQLQGNKQSGQAEVEFAKCCYCKLTEECTPDYIAHVRERFHGRWVCGLCVEEENTTDGAMKQHMSFYEEFRSSSLPTNPGEDLILAMKQLLRRTLESPRKKPLTCMFIFLFIKCFYYFKY
ncbi:hypothetical protein UlMin_039873 [Ulmus minor]